MTELLAQRAGRVIAIEIDPTLAQQLEESVENEPRIQTLQADILSTDIPEICRRYKTEQCFVFGNLPYYITSPILHHLFRSSNFIRAMALLMQREVAARLTASPGRRAYGYLSVLAQFHSEPRIVLTVPPGAFSPPPKVHSCLVDFQMRPRSPEWFKEAQGSGVGATHAWRARRRGVASPLQLGELENFLEFVKRCFAQKRKSLLNNLAGTYSRARAERAVADLGLMVTVRAEQLTLEQFASLFRCLR